MRKRISFLFILTLCLSSCSNSTYNHKLDDKNENLTFEYKKSIKDIYCGDDRYSIKHSYISYFFKMYYDNLLFLEIKHDDTYEVEAGINYVEYEIYKCYGYVSGGDLYWGIYDIKNNNLMRMKEAYDSSLVNDDDFLDMCITASEITKKRYISMLLIILKIIYY